MVTQSGDFFTGSGRCITPRLLVGDRATYERQTDKLTEDLMLAEMEFGRRKRPNRTSKVS